MKRYIWIFDMDELLCDVEINVGDRTIGTPMTTNIVYDKVTYSIMYIVGMDHGWVISDLTAIPPIANFDMIH